jgi:hypothetical protein
MMSPIEPARRMPLLTVLMLVYGAASLLHFAHNALFIADYPNLPAWLSSADVWATWFIEASIGLVGYVLIRRGFALPGLTLVAIWAALGFDGLAHYALAPVSAHSFVMNATIWTEVGAATLLSIVVAMRIARQIANHRLTPRL